MSYEQPGGPTGQPPGHQPPGGGYPPPGYQPYWVPPKHPQATTAMVLGILGIAVCGVLAPIAWVIGGKAVKEIDANPTAYSGRSEANAGRIMGIVGSCLIILGIVAFVVIMAVSISVEASA